MIISNIINDSFGLLSKQLRFYCWHFRRNLDLGQRQELVDLLHEQHFERLANKIRALNQTSIADCKQQVSKLLFEQCLRKDRRHQLKQLIESRLLDVNVRLDNYGRTLLHRFAYNLDVEFVKLLIDEGVNIRLRDYAGNTALHIAIQSYRNGAVLYGNEAEVVQNLTQIVRLLLEADRNQQNERYKQRKKRKLFNECNEESSDSPERNINLEDAIDADEDGCPSHDNHSKRSSSDSPLIGKFKTNSSKQAMTKDPLRCNRSKKEGYQSQQLVTTPIEDSAIPLNPILLEDLSNSLVDTKNAFGRTALHYCVLVVGEKHLDHFVKLLISFGADVDAIDTRMKTPLYCLVKRPGVSAIRHKCQAIAHLLKCGCDDLGLAIDPDTYFTNDLIKNMETNISDILQAQAESTTEPIFSRTTFKRVPTLKHLARLYLIKQQDTEKTQRQKKFCLPEIAPASLNLYINRKILDQIELF